MGIDAQIPSSARFVIGVGARASHIRNIGQATGGLRIPRAPVALVEDVIHAAGQADVFDKRQWRAGNAQTTGNATTGAYMYGAGAYTYNEPGRTWFMSVNTHF